MRNLALLLIAVVLFFTIDRTFSPSKPKVVRLDFRSSTTVTKTFTLFIPKSIKFDDELVNEKVSGVISLHIRDQKFVYYRPLDVRRNEYKLLDFDNVTETILAYKGDKIEFKFSKSNMPRTPESILFGEE